MNEHTERAMLLLQQRNHTQAENFLKQALEEDPEDAEALYLYSIVYSQKNAYAKALQQIDAAISMRPNTAHFHYMKAAILSDKGDLAKAYTSAKDSLALDPEDADTYGVLAQIHLRNKKYDKAIGRAQQGLEIDAEHELCRNVFSHAKAAKGETAEAYESSKETISLNPDSSVAHSSAGWISIRHGEYKQALEHFQESLRLSPNNESAKSGIVHALKAKNPIYAAYLNYINWISRMSNGMQIGFFVGIWFAMRLVRSFADTNPKLAPIGYAALGLYLLFIFSTWTAEALFNVMLFVHPQGRYALSKYEKWISVAMLVAVVTGLLCALSYFVFAKLALVGLGAGLVMMGIPLASLYSAETTRNRIIFGLQCLVIGGLSVYFTMLSWSDPSKVAAFAVCFLLVMLSTWVNSALISRER